MGVGHLVAHREAAEQIAAQGAAEWRNADAGFLVAMDFRKAFDHMTRGGTGSKRLANKADESHCKSLVEAGEVCHIRWPH